MRIAELEKEIDTLMTEKRERTERGKPVDDLETRIEELERRKHDLVEQLQDVWSS
jgi:polyhydroxyalkanoate synthesis regulator phasin